MIKNKGKEEKLILMVIFMKENGRMENFMEKEHSLRKIAIFILEIGSRISSKVSVKKFILMVPDMKGSLYKEEKKEKANLFGQINPNMKATFKIIESKEMEPVIGQMVEHMLDSGNITK